MVGHKSNGVLSKRGTVSFFSASLALNTQGNEIGHLDPAGLLYDGQDYFDPMAGIYVQPNSFVGVPEALQNTNRYSVAGNPVSSGVLATLNSGFRGDVLAGVLSVSANKLAGYYAEQVSARGTTSLLRPRFAGYGAHRSTWGTLSFQGSRGRFQREGLSGYFDISDPVHHGYGGRSLFSSRSLVEQVGENVYRTAAGDIIDLNSLGYGGNPRWLRNVTIRTEVAPYAKLRYPLGKFNPIARSVLGEALPFGIDAAFQLAMDWQTEMPVDYRIGRVGIAGGVGLLAGGLTTVGLTTLLGITPPGWIIIGTGVITGIFIEPYVSEWLFKRIGLDNTFAKN